MLKNLKKIREMDFYDIIDRLMFSALFLCLAVFFGFMAFGSICGGYPEGEIVVTAPLALLFFILSAVFLFVG